MVREQETVVIVRDDSERGIPPLVTHQPPSSMDDAPVIRGRMVQIPGWIIPLYAGLFIALGWFGGEQWRHPAPPQTLPLPVAHAALLRLNVQQQDYVLPINVYSQEVCFQHS